ncbi:armadillo-like helical domain-containing protein [Tieghemostelium lacteum]|uniref:Armadillo-like helical domain-containing protein n=1 Tax=Tieghemostelium lacteum TaxID=361077 RepID=A0A151ZFZ5_TIELA|nr:armadillo-like helical domain-containing protein [Tieghemostelium lacteum]|eukprot:KYQ92855.1 armadillo-like helical domain-containing protein [Tieghemostelium lacteum]
MFRNKTPKLSTLSLGNSTVPPNSLFHLFNSDVQVTTGVGQTMSMTRDQLLQQRRDEEKECVSIMLEIDKGIRSGNLGDQVESILFYGHLIKHHPTSMVINSVIFKLSDIFRNTNNCTVKYRILKVFQECSQELTQRLSNQEEVLKRIHSVILSNDPVARSLALRLLGSVPDLIADKLYIHHSIRSCLASAHDQVEVEATIFIMDKLCEISPQFSQSVIQKVNTAIQNLETPPSIKLKYIRLFRHMHHSTTTSSQSRDILQQLLDLYPSVTFINVILDTLTNLSLKHILFIDDQILLLNRYALNDPRSRVKVLSLKSLERLARISPHSLYPIQEIFTLLSNQKDQQVSVHCLQLLNQLSITKYQQLLQHCDGVDQLLQLTLDPNLSLSELSISILCNLIVEQQSNTETLSTNLVDNISKLLTLQFTSTTSSTIIDSKSSLLLQSIIKLVESNTEHAMIISKSIISLLPIIPRTNPSLFHLLYCLSIIVPMNKNSVKSSEVTIQNLTDYLSKLVESNVFQSTDKDLFICICMIIFRAYDENISEIVSIGDQLYPIIEKLHQNHPQYTWYLYVLAQYSQHYGFHQLANRIYKKLIYIVDSNSYYYWLKCLICLSNLEHSISNINNNNSTDLQATIEDLLSDYHQSTLLLKSSTGINEKSLQFQQEFLLCRENYIFNLLNLKSYILYFSNNNQQFYQKDSKLKVKSFLELIEKLKNLKSRNSNTKSIIESMINSSQIIIQLINLLLLDNKDYTIVTNNNNSVLKINKYPVEKFCKFLSDQIINNSSSLDVEFFNQVINGFLSIPSNYPIDFFRM